MKIETLINKLKTGSKVKFGRKRIGYGKISKKAEYTNHVIAVSDDNGERVFTFKRWFAGRKEWNYFAMPEWELELELESSNKYKNK